MAYENPICLKCKKPLTVGKVGVSVMFNYGGGYAQHWDTRECKTCGYEILYGNGDRIYNREDAEAIAAIPSTIHIP